MELKSTDLISIFEKALSGLPQEKLDEIGIVVQVGDNICKIHGLTNAIYGELITFKGGNRGIIMSLDEDYVSVFLLFNTIPVSEFEVAQRTGSVFTIPIGDKLLGRIINAVGKPIDGFGEIKTTEMRAVEQPIAGIIERSPINESLETGIMAIDALVPIGRGQRELIIGNRSTGKTTIVLSTILNQKDKGVICIYVSIGQRQAHVARIVRLLQEHGAMDYSIVVSADASEAVLNQYLAPYVGCTIGEYFREQKKDVLIIVESSNGMAIRKSGSPYGLTQQTPKEQTVKLKTS